jgi:capsular exopolysaccharide synthesis family protein
MSDQLVPGNSGGRRAGEGMPGHADYPVQRTGYEAAENELDLHALLYALRRQWPIVVGTLVLVVLAVGLYTFAQDPLYEARSVVLVETSTRGGGGAGAIDQLLSFERGNRTLLNEIAILEHSIPLAEAVAARLVDMRPDGPLARSNDGEETRPIGWIARGMINGSVRFEPVSQQTDLIRIRAYSTDPAEAATVANLYAEEYAARSQEASRASVVTSRAFLEEQSQAQRRELEAVEADLQAFVTREGAIALNAEAQNTVAQLAALDVSLEEARVELEIERTSLRSLEAELDRVEPGLTRRIASGVEREMRVIQDQLAELEVQAGAFYAVDPSLRGNEISEPELARITRQTAQLRQRLDVLSEQYVREVLAVGGLDGTSANGLGYVTQLQREIVQKRIRTQSLEAKEGVLRRQLSGYEERLRNIPRQSIQLAQLERQRAAISDTYLFLMQKLQEARLAEQSQLGYVQVIRQADQPYFPIRPRKSRNMAVGLLLGLVLGIGMALVRTSLDHRVHGLEQLRNAGFPVLGVTPDIRRLVRENFDGKETVVLGNYEVDSTIAAGLHPLSPLTEAMRQVRTAIRFSSPDRRVQTIVITSAGPREGKTTTAVNLAISMANAGHRTLLVDGDLRRPTIKARLGIGGSRGLTDLLFQAGRVDWEAFRYRLSVKWVGFEDSVDNLFVVPAGKRVANPAELLGSHRMRELVAEMRGTFDMIIFDAPPVLSITDPVLLANVSDAVVLTAMTDETDHRGLERAREQVGLSGTPVLGVVLNRHDASVGGYGYNYAASYGRSYGASDRFAVFGDGADQAHEVSVKS